ncbi:hypothetical protein L1887_48469 [Cichorium endivia]|nr:hypothetical protein L1887_48469 [Cichorium endivia]
MLTNAQPPKRGFSQKLMRLAKSRDKTPSDGQKRLAGSIGIGSFALGRPKRSIAHRAHAQHQPAQHCTHERAGNHSRLQGLLKDQCGPGETQRQGAFRRAWLVVELRVDCLDLARHGSVDVRSRLDLEMRAEHFESESMIARQYPIGFSSSAVDGITYRLDSSDFRLSVVREGGQRWWMMEKRKRAQEEAGGRASRVADWSVRVCLSAAAAAAAAAASACQ